MANAMTLELRIEAMHAVDVDNRDLTEVSRCNSAEITALRKRNKELEDENAWLKNMIVNDCVEEVLG